MYVFYLGLRYLRARLISYLAILGVALGVGLIIIVTSVMSGFAKDMRARIRGTTSHITVSPYGLGELVRDWEPVYRAAAQVDDVVGVAPRLEWLVIFKGGEGYGWIVGFDPEYERHATEFGQYIYPLGASKVDFRIPDGRVQMHPGVYIGVDRPYDEGELPPPGENYTLSSVRQSSRGYELLQGEFTTVGYFYSGFAEYDMSHILMSLETAQKFVKAPGAITRLCISVRDWDDTEALERTRDRVAAAVAPHGLFQVQTWEDERRTFLRAVEAERRINVILMFFIVGVASLLIACFLLMMVGEKKKDIGVLAALGAPVRGVMVLFLFEALFISCMGTLLGVGGGALLAYNLNPIADFIHQWTGWHPFPPDVYLLSRIPCDISADSILMVASVTVLCSALFSLLPAWKAGRLDPVEALRYE